MYSIPGKVINMLVWLTSSNPFSQISPQTLKTSHILRSHIFPYFPPNFDESFHHLRISHISETSKVSDHGSPSWRYSPCSAHRGFLDDEKVVPHLQGPSFHGAPCHPAGTVFPPLEPKCWDNNLDGIWVGTHQNEAMQKKKKLKLIYQHLQRGAKLVPKGCQFTIP